MRVARVYFKEEEAGLLTQHDDGSFTFQYGEEWVIHPDRQSISLTLPKRKRVFHSAHLFPFFYSLLPEGSNRKVICAMNRIDKTDDFGLLMAIARYDSIGAVRVIKKEQA